MTETQLRPGGEESRLGKAVNRCPFSRDLNEEEPEGRVFQVEGL